MKKAICLILVFLTLLCGCSHNIQPDQTHTDVPSISHEFIINENGNIVSDSGVEYAHLANEGLLCILCEMEFVGSVQGEEKTSQHLGVSYQTGMFAFTDTGNDNILIRRTPDNEWFGIYRKTSLPQFDFSVDNCIRLEFSSYKENSKIMMDPSEIASFLSDVRSQKDPHEAGLYDLIKQPNGNLENCYLYGVIYGFFEVEPYLAVRMEITSYNDLAYSICIQGKEYVLPTEWLQKFENK